MSGSRRERSAAGARTSEVDLLSTPLIVLDTQVIISALIGSEEASSYRIVRAAGTGEVRLALSDAFLVELVRTVRRRYEQGLIVNAARAFEVALDLGLMGELYTPAGHEWPSIPDPGDYWIPDLAWESGADFVVSGDPHLHGIELPFPVEVVTSTEFVGRL